jgi:hypothetical protein
MKHCSFILLDVYAAGWGYGIGGYGRGQGCDTTDLQHTTALLMRWRTSHT